MPVRRDDDTNLTFDRDDPRLCPECGRLLSTTTPEKHVLDHWPVELPPERIYDVARERRNKLLQRSLYSLPASHESEVTHAVHDSGMVSQPG